MLSVSEAAWRVLSLGGPTMAGGLLATLLLMPPRTRSNAQVRSSRSLSAPSKSQAPIPNTGRKVRDLPRFWETGLLSRWVHPQIARADIFLTMVVLHFFFSKATPRGSQNRSSVKKAGYWESGSSATIVMSPA